MTLSELSGSSECVCGSWLCSPEAPAWVPEQCACVVSNLNMSKPDLSLPESGELCTDIK